MSRPVEAELCGHHFRFFTTPGLFSAERVDDGTRLLLEHLPRFAPDSILDLGCGWGALGLPIAASYPSARCLLVDRDALAADWSAKNALSHGLDKVVARPSLGYRDVEGPFDWVLCNVPARIGAEAIEYIVGAGAALLTPRGELRVVVIRDLDPVLFEIADRTGWPLARVVEGARHSVWSCAPISRVTTDHESLYLRDQVNCGGFQLDRPHDVNEDREHLTTAMPLLLECLPKKPVRVLSWRAGYGPVATTLQASGSQVVAADRDLLALAYSKRNAPGIETRPAPSLGEALGKERFSLIVAEHVPSAGDEVAIEEWRAACAALPKGGLALWLGRSKSMRLSLEKGRKHVEAIRIATRGAWEVVRITTR